MPKFATQLGRNQQLVQQEERYILGCSRLVVDHTLLSFSHTTHTTGILPAKLSRPSQFPQNHPTTTPTQNNFDTTYHNVGLPASLLQVRFHARHQHLLQPLPPRPVRRLRLNPSPDARPLVLEAPSVLRSTIISMPVDKIAICGDSRRIPTRLSVQQFSQQSSTGPSMRKPHHLCL
jgi:hypothetical protein